MPEREAPSREGGRKDRNEEARRAGFWDMEERKRKAGAAFSVLELIGGRTAATVKLPGKADK